MLSALSPLDGRYEHEAAPLRHFFSEEALIRARVFVEVRYLAALSKAKLLDVPTLGAADRKLLLNIADAFSSKDALRVKEREITTKHDVKAVEYELKALLDKHPKLKKLREFVHFALTSEDTNNLAYGLMIHGAVTEVMLPAIDGVLQELVAMAKSWKGAAMLSLTHGQPATQTTVSKELLVYVDRLSRQVVQLRKFRMQGKCSGAVGTFSAHKAAYPEVHWEKFAASFITELGLIPLKRSTQINPHDDLAELSHISSRINTILLDLSRDMWLYISRNVFLQKVVSTEIGSSTMPHKVNPIDFENAEGNVGISTALFLHFAEKLPVSRLQRDLSDSTVQRNIGVAFGHQLLALSSLVRGLKKLTLNRERLQRELLEHPEIVAEAIQTVMRRHGVKDAYEKLKELTRGRSLSSAAFAHFIDKLAIPEKERERLKRMLP
jgi:adenylosuccinate lyase